jgi:hypothetical protein
VRQYEPTIICNTYPLYPIVKTFEMIK